MISRRQFLIGLGGGMAIAATTPLLMAAGSERVIHITARRFEYTPSTVTIAAGEAVILEILVSDVVMGFNLPDLKLRADLVPGQPARLRLPPQPAGELPFFCDVFCGSGHENMNGVIKVVA
ncbi:cupredoxin domain-containing protein [Crenobacter sp. SG2303]|uniref:Nitrous-oxide reductase n=1 Tax=Crenobacter oryzisoli TaxID=3056844 RepID=A0ABT7XUJ6_9NEIS|nr:MULTISPECIES: cupredoxin domain-containing protein [unclassified Crenobacter]MDN0077443.1 cupredoxin domain-containing protein [Crenobacter sp. SG2303]MDN0084990.1 cupredoxin domain-containing protein [Crenobacter sp. SG2305]